MSSSYVGRPRPSDRLIQTTWLMSLARGENLPMPTIERVNTLKRLAASWADEVMNRFLGWLAFWRRLSPAFPRIAVFVDGDGVSPKDAEMAIAWAARRGRITVLRAYGNYTGRAAVAWTSLIRRRSILARHMPTITAGKNAADVALTIDAVELLLTRPIDIYVLIVSDTDLYLSPTASGSMERCLGSGSVQPPKPFGLPAILGHRQWPSLQQPRAGIQAPPQG